jgi:hypothetical protein
MGTHRLRLPVLIVACVLALCVGVAADSFTAKLVGYFIPRGADVRLTIHVPYDEHNRSISYEWTGETGDGGYSSIDLTEGDHVTTRVTWERYIHCGSEGAHELLVMLHTTEGNKLVKLNYEVK